MRVKALREIKCLVILLTNKTVAFKCFFRWIFFEKIERLGYLSYRIFLKLKLGNISIINKTYRLFDSLFEYSFMTYLPSEIMDFAEEKYLFISEFPSLRRPRNNWIRKKFCSSIFLLSSLSSYLRRGFRSAISVR